MMLSHDDISFAVPLGRWRILLGRANEAAGDRTQDPQIKSLLLYQLSYGLIAPARVHFIILRRAADLASGRGF